MLPRLGAASLRHGRRAGAAPAQLRRSHAARSVSFSAQQRVVAEQLLRTVGSEEDLEVYERHFAKGEQHLVVVKAGGEVIRDELDVFVKGLQAMKAVGLFPIVVHGGGPQMNQIMEEQGIEPQYAAGLRVTDMHVLGAARCPPLRPARALARSLFVSPFALRAPSLRPNDRYTHPRVPLPVALSLRRRRATDVPGV